MRKEDFLFNLNAIIKFQFITISIESIWRTVDEKHIQQINYHGYRDNPDSFSCFIQKTIYTKLFHGFNAKFHSRFCTHSSVFFDFKNNFKE